MEASATINEKLTEGRSIPFHFFLYRSFSRHSSRIFDIILLARRCIYFGRACCVALCDRTNSESGLVCLCANSIALKTISYLVVASRRECLSFSICFFFLVLLRFAFQSCFGRKTASSFDIDGTHRPTLNFSSFIIRFAMAPFRFVSALRNVIKIDVNAPGTVERQKSSGCFSPFIRYRARGVRSTRIALANV